MDLNNIIEDLQFAQTVYDNAADVETKAKAKILAEKASDRLQDYLYADIMEAMEIYFNRGESSD